MWKVLDFQNRALFLKDVRLALCEAASGRRQWVALNDYPSCVWEEGRLVLSDHASAPDLKIDFKPAVAGFVNMSFRFEGRVFGSYEGLRFRFLYRGQQQFENHQSYFACHSFAFNGVKPELTRQPKLVDGAPEPSKFQNLLFRERRGVAWWLTALKAKNSPESFFAGALSPHRLKTTFTVVKSADGHEVDVFMGLQGDRLPLASPGDSVGFCISDAILKTFEDYAGLVAKPDLKKPATVGWSSWYEYYNRIDEKILARQSKLLNERLLWKGFSLFQIDDGYQTRIGEWTPKFPLDVEGTKRLGLTPGIWFAPLLVDQKADLKNQDWFLHDYSGHRVIYKIPRHSTNSILDITHPEVQEWIVQQVVDFKNRGFRFLKIDFLLLGLVSARRFDPRVSPLQAYRMLVELIREAAGPDMTILHSGSVDILGAGAGDANRTGPDIAYDVFGGNPGVRNIRAQMTATASHFFMLNRWFTPNPDVVVLRSGLSDRLAEVMLAQVAMAGGDYVLSDDIGRLSQDRLELLTHPLFLFLAKGRGHLLPLDYFSNLSRFKMPPNPFMLASMQNPPRIWLWRNGEKSVLFLYNLENRKMNLKVDLVALSNEVYGETLFTDGRWSDLLHGQSLEIRTGKIDLTLPARSVRVFDLGEPRI